MSVMERDSDSCKEARERANARLLVAVAVCLETYPLVV